MHRAGARAEAARHAHRDRPGPGPAAVRARRAGRADRRRGRLRGERLRVVADALAQRARGRGSAAPRGRRGRDARREGLDDPARGRDAADIPPVPAARVVDPTGCGDAYRAAFLHGLSRGLPLETVRPHGQPDGLAKGRGARHAEPLDRRRPSSACASPRPSEASRRDARGEEGRQRPRPALAARGARGAAAVAAGRAPGRRRPLARGHHAARRRRDRGRGLPALLGGRAGRARHPAVARDPRAGVDQRAARVRGGSALRDPRRERPQLRALRRREHDGGEPAPDRSRLGGRGAARVLPGPHAAPRDPEPPAARDALPADVDALLLPDPAERRDRPVRRRRAARSLPLVRRRARRRGTARRRSWWARRPGSSRASGTGRAS